MIEIKKTHMPSQAPEVRRNNFSEVSLGYSEKEALIEASRCLNCKNKPCVSGCPVNVNIPDFISKIVQNKYEDAFDIISSSNSLPAICGRVCPQENQCEGKCIRGIKGESVAIGRLERFVADIHNSKNISQTPVEAKNGYKVAIVGSGPSGLACAGDLIKLGYDVTIFEALHTPGGVLVYGIPEFRLPKNIVEKEINSLKELGVKIETNIVIGKTISVDELLNEYKFNAVYIGSGAGLPKFMGIPGENLKGVFSANEFLTRVTLMKAYNPQSDTPVYKAKKVCVVGGGNVAMDAARCALRLGAETVSVVYRRSQSELPARKEEVEHAIEEGIDFKFLTSPVKICSNENGFVSAIECVQMELGEPDASGRRSPVEVENSNYTIECDCVIMSIGTSPNPLIKSTTSDLETNKKGCICVDSTTGKTSKDFVYAGGDVVTGAATVILAMEAGKTAAQSIDEYFKNK